VVKIHGIDEHSEICGTGFFIDPTGRFTRHTRSAAKLGNFTIEFNGKKYPARQLLADIRSGTAVLKIEAPTSGVADWEIGGAASGNACRCGRLSFRLPETPNFGMVAGFDRKYLGRYFSTTHLRVNLPTQRGEAGAPLLNMKGEVVGIVVSSLENNSACYAVPLKRQRKSAAICPFRRGQARLGRDQCFRDVRAGGRFTSGNDSDHGRHAGGPFRNQTRRCAAASGTKKVTQPEDVLDASFFITAGDTVPITVMRADQKLTFNVRATFTCQQECSNAAGRDTASALQRSDPIRRFRSSSSPRRSLSEHENASARQQFPKLRFVDNTCAELFRLIELAFPVRRLRGRSRFSCSRCY
jgi:serine protease Do